VSSNFKKLEEFMKNIQKGVIVFDVNSHCRLEKFIEEFSRLQKLFKMLKKLRIQSKQD